MACSVWKVPWLPVMPWQMTRVSLLTRTDIGWPLFEVREVADTVLARDDCVFVFDAVEAVIHPMRGNEPLAPWLALGGHADRIKERRLILEDRTLGVVECHPAALRCRLGGTDPDFFLALGLAVGGVTLALASGRMDGSQKLVATLHGHFRGDRHVACFCRLKTGVHEQSLHAQPLFG